MANPRKFDVYGVGNAIIDLQLEATDQQLAQFGLEKSTMKLVEAEEQVELLSQLGDKGIHRASGGSAANTMIALTQLGAKTAYGCIVGDDGNGHFYLKEMSELGVVLHTAPKAGEHTGSCVVLITPDAERTMNTHLGASSGFGPEHVSEELISESAWVYIEGYLFAQEKGRLAAQRTAELAKKHGAKIALTFSDVFIVDVFGERLREVAGGADLVFANFREAQQFTRVGTDGSSPDNVEEAVFASLCSQFPNAVMTMSERGARVYYDGQSSFIEPFTVKAVDDTGAGDMFAGGFLYGITHGMKGEQAGKLSCFLASRVVSQLGPRLKGDVAGLAKSAGCLA